MKCVLSVAKEEQWLSLACDPLKLSIFLLYSCKVFYTFEEVKVFCIQQEEI